jgi:peptidyl-prolyl cis-trans isomerase D
MLQNIREKVQGTTAKIVVGLIVVSFSLFGIESILVGGGGNEVAEVNGEPIQPQELQQALDTQKRRLIAMMGDNLDPSLLDDERLGPQALEALINRKLLMQSADEMGLTISNSEIGTLVASMDQFQVDGVFSPEAYKNVLASAGYTPSYFKQSLYDDMLVNQLRSGIAGSEFVTPGELEVNTRIVAEQRNLRYFTIPRGQLPTPVQFTDAQIQGYYDAHQDNFRSPESVDIDYLELTLDDFREPVEESAVLEAYELAKQDSQFQAQSRVSHILFETDTEDEVSERIAKAQKKLANGESFADVARELSDDVGSADKGGDLGYTSGNTFPAAMESAITQLQPGAVSGPVQTEAGTHLILVTERSEGKEVSLEEMRSQLTETIQEDEARIVLLRSVESLKDLSFNSEDLTYPANELGLSVKRADAVTRAQNEGLFANSTLVEAAFSEEVLQAGNNSEVIELPDNRFVVLSVRKHNPPELKPLDSVRGEVVAALAEETARAVVIAQAGQVLEKLRTGLPLDQIVAELGYELQVEMGVDRRNTVVPPEVLRRVFELPTPAADAVSADYVLSSNGDAVVVELQRVNAGDYKSLPVTEQTQLEQLLADELSSLVDREFQSGLRDRAEITVL